MRTLLLLGLFGCDPADSDPVATDADRDGDGVLAELDCDDADDTVGAAETRYADADGDGHGDAGNIDELCGTPSGWAETAGDCDDADPDVHPGTAEHCDGEDEDCDGVVDEDPVDAGTLYVDGDGDGIGGVQTVACPGAGLVDASGDCDDGDSDVFPGADDACGDDLDQDCDGTDSSCPWQGEWTVGEADAIATITGQGDRNNLGAHAVLYGPDVNGDGQSDLLLSSTLATSSAGFDGEVYVFTSLPTGTVTTASADIVIGAGAYWAISGLEVASADLDDDGFSDVLIGDRYYRYSAYRGGVYVHSGAGLVSGLTPDDAAAIWVSAEGTDYGRQLAVGDHNGDGYVDLLVDKSGAGTDVYHGPLSLTEAPTADVNITPGGVETVFSDLDGDGADELVVAQDGYPGTVYVVDSERSGTVTLPDDADASLAAEASDDWFAQGVVADRDLDGDGLNDVVTSATNADTSIGADAGVVYVVLGDFPASGSAADADAIIEGEVAMEYLGYSFGTAPDVTGDGLPDLLVGNYRSDVPATDAGRAWVFTGSTLTGRFTTSAADVTLTMGSGSMELGYSVGSTPDLDGDGWPELLLSATGYDTPANEAGAVFLLPGGPRR